MDDTDTDSDQSGSLPTVGCAGDHSRESTIAVFFSVTGSAGKSFLAELLAKHWLSSQFRTVLIDGDLVGATVSRSILKQRVEKLEGAMPWACTTSLDLFEGTSPLEPLLGLGPNKIVFVPAAPWLVDYRDLQAAKKAFEAPKDLDAFHKVMQDARRKDSLREGLKNAQAVQAQVHRDLGMQRRFWRRIVDEALHEPTNLIIDLPAQGPAGVGLIEHWSQVCRDAAKRCHDRPRSSNVDRLRLVRVVVEADGLDCGHPLFSLLREEEQPPEKSVFVVNLVLDPKDKEDDCVVIPVVDSSHGLGPISRLIRQDIDTGQTLAKALRDVAAAPLIGAAALLVQAAIEKYNLRYAYPAPWACIKDLGDAILSRQCLA